MTKGRPPRKDEFELWQNVAKTTQPLHPSRPTDVTIPASTDERSKPRTVINGLPKTLKSHTNGYPNKLAPGLPEQLRTAPLQMDKKTFGQMNRGRLEPEARLDLHGMTLDRAHPTLTSFILRSHAAGKRLVLVITGKGKSRDDGGPIPVRQGVLKHQVPQWLNTVPLSPVVLQIVQAHQKHGGGGAYYVYLRRHR